MYLGINLKRVGSGDIEVLYRQQLQAHVFRDGESPTELQRWKSNGGALGCRCTHLKKDFSLCSRFLD
jgi:hypothetical protein